MVAGGNSREELKRQHQALKTASAKSRMESVDSTLPSDLLWSKETSTFFKKQEEEKKRKYQQRVLDVEMGSFTPVVFRTNRGIGADCNCFLKRLADKLSEKNEEPYHITITWIRTLLFFRFQDRYTHA